MSIVTCPTTDRIEELLRGEILGSDAACLAEHFESCQKCLLAVVTLAKKLESLSVESAPDASVSFQGTAAGAEPIEEAPNTVMSLPQPDGTLFGSELVRDPLKFLSPPQKPEELGRLAHYSVIKILGEGGMGIVLLAEDTLLERRVALKVIKPEYHNDASVRQRFLREARLMASLKSDHVVTIHQVGQEESICFIAMELLEGESLDYLVARVSRPPLSETIRIGREIAQALEAAHVKRLIHRDIKPENIWLESPHGRVKLLDFGLARPQKVNVRLTTSGMIMGTPAYMAPEQGRAQEVDERTDLFSLGCIMYELICGELPFFGDTVWEILFALNEKEPLPLRDHCPEISQELNDLVMQLLEKNPDKRPQTAAEVIERLLTIEGTIGEEGNFSFAVRKGAGVSRSINPKNRSQAGIARQNSVNVSAVGKTQMVQRDAERRQVTVLVCNCSLFESEVYFEQLDAKEQASIMQDFQRICQQAVQIFDGAVIHFNDEGLLACFGFPIAYEDAAIRAASAAVEIRELLTHLGEELKNKSGLNLHPWIGVHTGLAIAKTKDDGISLVGEARSIATKLKEVAVSGQIVCSQATHKLLWGRFDCSSIGSHKFKSLSEPIDLFNVKVPLEVANPVDIAAPVELTPLTGRDLEINLLKDRWEQAKESMGQIVTLVGEAGLGKSRLVHAMKQIVLEETTGQSATTGNAMTHTNLGMPVGLQSPIIEWRCSPHFQNSGFYPAVNFFERLLHLTRDTSGTFAFFKQRPSLMWHGEPRIRPS